MKITLVCSFLSALALAAWLGTPVLIGQLSAEPTMSDHVPALTEITTTKLE